MIHPNEIALRALADEVNELDQRLDAARTNSWALVNLLKKQSDLLDTLARREINRSLEAGAFLFSLRAALGEPLYNRRKKNEFRVAFGSEAAWFVDS